MSLSRFPAPSPLVGVTTRFAKGAEGVTDPGLELCTVRALAQALAETWTTDAHLLPYQLLLAGEPCRAWPRINKTALEPIRARGGDVRTVALVLDWDTPGHVPLTPELREGMDRQLCRAADAGLPWALSWTHLYATRGGLRLVYTLSHPLTPEEHEPVYKGLLRDFLAYGIRLDPQCHAWNWSFRLPCVMRDAERTWLAPYFELIDQPAFTLDPSRIQPEGMQRSFSRPSASPSSDPRPSPERCHELLWRSGAGGKDAMSDWQRLCKAKLRGRVVWDACFSGAPLAAKGGRNSGIQRVAGELCAMLAGEPAASEEAIYALLEDPLLRLDEERDRDEQECFRDTGWSAVRRYWASERARIDAERAERAELAKAAEARKETLLQRVIRGTTTWSSAPELRESEESALRWLSSHALVSLKDHFHVLKPDGFYDSLPVKASLLPARIRELGMTPLIPLEVLDGARAKAIKSQELVNHHATVVRDAEGAIGIKGGELRDSPTGPVLVLPMFSRRDDLEPTFDVEVDCWLQLLAGTEYPRLCAWLGHALAFEDGPICSLSIKGCPGVGKKLLYIGLSECIDTALFGTGAEFGVYQGVLLRTPFIVVNEGLPSSVRGTMHPADAFRAFVSGDPIRINEKYLPAMWIRNPLRILFLANNLDVVNELVGSRDLSPEDREALAIRLLHIVADAKAASWLRSRGGLRFTDGWIRRDNGIASDYRVARHILWLYAHRPRVPDGARFLVEGNANSEIIRQMTTRSGSSPAVVEALIRMVEAQNAPEGVAFDGNRILVTTKGVVDFHRTSLGFGSSHRELNYKTVGQVLEGLKPAGADTFPRFALVDGKLKKARWREVDASLLLQEAIEHGFSVPRLESLALGQVQVRDGAQRAVEEIQASYLDAGRARQ